jgi:sulfur transfer protein SufE
MKRHWKKHRQFQHQPDGEQRWDRAYQYLLQWGQEIKPSQTTNSENDCEGSQEVNHENRRVREGFHKESS